MPIGGFVITIDPEKKETVLKQLENYPEVEVHGADEQGNIIAVLDTQTSDDMERLTKKLQDETDVLSLGITYFDAEDEMEKIERGEMRPTFSFGRKGEKT